MFGRIKKFAALSRRQQGYFIEAWVRLGICRFLLLSRPFKSLVSDLSMQAGYVESESPTTDQLAIALEIGESVRRAAGFTPWESACLVQVLAARPMLQKRGIGGAFYLGATRPSEPLGAPGMSAHAWLKCGNQFITGESGHERFTVLTSFSW